MEMSGHKVLPHKGCVALPYPETKLIACVCDVVSELPERCPVGTYSSCEGGTRGVVVKIIPVGTWEGEGGKREGGEGRGREERGEEEERKGEGGKERGTMGGGGREERGEGEGKVKFVYVIKLFIQTKC